MSGIRIPDMPVLGAVTDDSAFVGEHAGSGLFNATAVTTYVAASPVLRSTQNNVGRNLLHNGLFNVAQRGAGPFSAIGYTLDRWRLAFSLDVSSVSQVALGAFTAAIGDEEANNAIAANVAGNAGAASFTVVDQYIENVRRLAGKTVTVSFWAYAVSGSPKIGVAAGQVFGTGGSPSANVLINGTATPTLSSVPTRYSVTFAYPSMAGKTLGTNGDSYSRLALFFSSGANTNAFAGGIGVQSATFVLWGVQLEISTQATPLEKLEYADDLRHCQRFYQVANFQALSSQSIAGGYISSMVGLPATMRATPTLTPTFTTQTNVTSPTAGQVSTSVVLISGTATAAGIVNIAGSFTASADL